MLTNWRPIKFRVWEKEKRKMGKVLTLYINDDGTYTGHGDFGDPISEPLIHNFTIMQYLGLQDRNGKEIYEGDIVKLRKQKFLKFRKLYGEYEVGIGVIRYSEKTVSFEIDVKREDYDMFFYSPDGQEFRWSDLEVIGNIYENPELIE